MNNHTGKELQLMLERRKPLSMFYDDERIIPEVAFGKFVELGQFSKAERIFDLAYDPRLGRNRRVRYVLYCLNGEEWRFEAMWLVLRAVRNTLMYDEGLDRMTGYLLGYTDDEINAHIAARTSSDKPVTSETRQTSSRGSAR
jgi:hypothetical protein